MTKSLSYTISSPSPFCEIEIQQGMLHEPQQLIAHLAPLSTRFAIISDDNNATLYGNPLAKALVAHGLEAYVFSFPAGEQSKSRQMKEQLEDQMLAKKLSRDTCLIALGGGVTTDLGGFIAATYCRGIPLVMVPTSLLGMVDACMGGKTGINVLQGKNLLGSIHHPKKILIDPAALKTLPLQALRCGIVEMIKHGLIADKSYFAELDVHCHNLLALQADIVEKAIFDSCRIKTAIVQQDVKEQGERYLLNFGHTVGHALENLTNYTISHGEAVAIGLLVESYLAVQLGHLQLQTLESIRSLLVKYGLPLQLPTGYSSQTIIDAMALDKKSLKGQPRFVLIKDIGHPLTLEGQYCFPVDKSIITNALEWMNNDLCCHSRA